MKAPLCIDLFCGCFGWSRPWLELGGYAVGFDLEHLDHHGPVPQGADLVIQDVLTLHGSQFRNASLILASPPCQFFSYTAMPWTRAKNLAKAVRADPERLDKELALFRACFRIQREASAAAGHHIPMVVENVRGIQPWVGKAAWNFGSFYLFGDVPALMPITNRRTNMKVGGINWSDLGKPDYKALAFNGTAEKRLREADGVKLGKANPDHRLMENWGRGDGIKQGGDWFNAASLDGDGLQSISRRSGSKSTARKMAAARIAMIPFPLASHIARVYYPQDRREGAA